jgi:ABC-type multidrug transport system fused ATPase/permease subunit
MYESILEIIFSDPIYLGVLALLIIIMIYAFIKKIIKLALFISISLVFYVVYLNYTNQVVPKNINELKKNVTDNVDKLKSAASESIDQVKSTTKKAIEEEIDKKLEKILDK